jgi:transketolase
MLDIAYEITKQLASDGIKVSLISMPTLKPIDGKLILAEARKTKKLVTLEEHSVIGGLGSATSDILSSSGIHAKLLIIGFPDRFIDVTGSIEYLRASVGLSKEKIYKQIKKEFSFS